MISVPDIAYVALPGGGIVLEVTNVAVGILNLHP